MKKKTFREIVVIGAGSVGGFFGAHLAKHHANVSFLLRPRTFEAIRNHGLTIRSQSETLTVHPRVASDFRDLPRPDLLILGIKAYDVPETLRQIGPFLDDRTVVLTLQNGVTIEDDILAAFPRAHVVGGVAFIYSKIVSPGVIEHYKRGTVTIGECTSGETLWVNAIAELFRTADIPCQVSHDIRRVKWEKMCWNCVFNPLTVMLNDHVAKALDHPDMLRVISCVIEEIRAVAAARQIDLSEGMADKVIRLSQDLRDIHTSMYDDWKAGRPTEIDYLNGLIVELGRQHGIPTPVNQTLTAIIKALTTEPASEHSIRIEGEVVQPVSVDGPTLATLSAEDQVRDVGTLAAGWEGTGIRIKALLDMVTPCIDVDHVMFHSRDGHYAATLSLAEAKEYGILLYALHGQPLQSQKGGPFRLVVPGLGDLCANVKNVARMELIRGPGKDTRPDVRN